ncbi:Xylose isomerase [Pararobbsia alpina]|uniref:xylose isomerase n=1 Tax=Pararobbsia alpina TaxID=621374 RepID=UPI0039A71840
MAEPMFIGVDVGGAMPGASGNTRRSRQADHFRLAAEAGVFDFVETHASAGDDLAPYFDLVDRYALPVRVIDGTWGIGRDEAKAKDVIDAGSRVGGKVLNLRLCGHRADGALLSDDEVVAFYLRLCEWGDRVGCVPSLDACSVSKRDRTRVTRLGERITNAGAPFRVTLDLSDLPPLSHGASNDAGATRGDLSPISACSAQASDTPHSDWIAQGWVYHVRTHGLLSRTARKTRAARTAARGIHAPPPVTSQVWAVNRAEGWKRELRQLIRLQANELRPWLRQITCAFASAPGQRRDAALDALSDNVACARWLRDTWLCQMEQRYGSGIHA